MDDFSNYIAAFKGAGCEIDTDNMVTPDLATFWARAAQQSFNPKVLTIGKALYVPLGDRLPGRAWRRVVLGSLMVTEQSFLIFADRGVGRRSGPRVATSAGQMGGNVRVGLEDSRFIERGALASLNAQQVAKIRRIVEELGCEVASPDEAREILDLKVAIGSRFDWQM